MLFPCNERSVDKLAAVVRGSTGSWHTRTLYLAITRDSSDAALTTQHTRDWEIPVRVSHIRGIVRAFRRFLQIRRPRPKYADVTWSLPHVCACQRSRGVILRCAHSDGNVSRVRKWYTHVAARYLHVHTGDRRGENVAGSLRLRKCTILPTTSLFFARFLVPSFFFRTSLFDLLYPLIMYGYISDSLISPFLDNKRSCERTTMIRFERR